MKKMISILSVAALTAGLMVSAQTAAANEIDTANLDMHTIGVLVYNLQDEEVISFHNYLKGYIQECFPDVDFLYSSSITSQEEEMEFIQNVADAGAEGILSFNSYDLKKEVELCEENGIYYMIASGSVSEDSFASVEDNEFFLGVVGPGRDIEYQAGVDLAAHFAEEHESGEYFILSGGASMGNEMHKLRTEGILDELQKQYGVTFTQTSEDLALSASSTHAEAGDLKVCVTPGYLDFDVFLDPAREEYEKDQYANVLSVLPIVEMQPVVEGANLGLIDCYNERNMQLYNSGDLDYITGKFSSIIGPSFAAMYNAVTGYAADFREDGKAFQVTQGFWTSDSAEDYAEKYALSSSIAINAYNYEDLQSVCKRFNPDADLNTLKEIASAYTFEDVCERRGQ